MSNLDKTVYMIWDKKLRKYQSSYSRAYHDEYEFCSVTEAREANCHGMFKESKYDIHKYRVIYKRIK